MDGRTTFVRWKDAKSPFGWYLIHPHWAGRVWKRDNGEWRAVVWKRDRSHYEMATFQSEDTASYWVECYIARQEDGQG